LAGAGLVEIRAADLRFTSDEANAYLNAATDLHLAAKATNTVLAVVAKSFASPGGRYASPSTTSSTAWPPTPITDSPSRTPSPVRI
jgi:hypothetical protein